MRLRFRKWLDAFHLGLHIEWWDELLIGFSIGPFIIELHRPKGGFKKEKKDEV